MQALQAAPGLKARPFARHEQPAGAVRVRAQPRDTTRYRCGLPLQGAGQPEAGLPRAVHWRAGANGAAARGLAAHPDIGRPHPRRIVQRLPSAARRYTGDRQESAPVVMAPPKAQGLPVTLRHQGLAPPACQAGVFRLERGAAPLAASTEGASAGAARANLSGKADSGTCARPQWGRVIPMDGDPACPTPIP